MCALFMEPILETKDFLVSGESFSICKDQDRDWLKTSPIPEDLDPYYDSEEYLSHKDSARGLLATLYGLIKKFSTKRKIKLIQRYAQDSKSILDIGAGTGDLLVAARKEGFQVAGVEPNSNARQLALKKNLQLNQEIDFDQKFKIITLWHVLEHFKEPGNQISRIKKSLKEDGTLFIAVPNYKSYDAEYYGEYWAAYDVPRHVWHFSRSAIQDLFEEHQMTIVETRPMPFDAYYISLMSEKYKHGKHRFFNALYRGWLSNMKARKSGEYSSLLYILQNQR